MSEKDRKSGSPDPTTGSGAADRTNPELVIALDVESALRGFGFPGSSRALVARALQNGAEESVVERLGQLPERTFTSLGDVLRQLSMLS